MGEGGFISLLERRLLLAGTALTDAGAAVVDDALAAFRYGIEVAPDDEMLYLNLARFYARSGDRAKANDILQQLLARQQQLTLSTFLQGAWALLLSEYSGADDVIFGMVVAGRPPELAGVEEPLTA